MKAVIVDQIDFREPKDIIKTELFLTAPMIRRIINCTYPNALKIIKKGLEYEKEQKLYINEFSRVKTIRTSTLKKIMNL